MPSASSAKPDKQSSTEATTAESSSNTSQQNTPIKQAIVIIEHKIRNLDKRKAKLETYRELQRAGKDLNQDQKVAVDKYDEVSQTLEFARDLCKQFHNIVTITEKEAKKLARKEELHRRQQDLAKIREVLLIQDALTQMGAETTREDFLLGRNGAAQISPEDLQLLDDLYPIVSPKHPSECEEEKPEFTVQVQQAADHLLAVVDGRQKEFSGSTFAHVKKIIETIHSCGYLNKLPIVEEPVVANVDAAVAEEWSANETHPEQDFRNTADVQQEIPTIPEVDRIPDQMPPMPNFPPVPEQMVQASVVSVVEHQPAFFQPPPQPIRPINEMLETGNFFFLQESELDSPPELVTQHPQLNPVPPIPSQTFTNQNFTTVPNAVPPLNTFANPNLPPPIPMPPSHATNVQQTAAMNTFNPEKTSANTFTANQEYETFTTSNKIMEVVEPKTVTRDDHKNGTTTSDWSEHTDDRHNRQQRVGNAAGGNRNRSGGGGYYQNNYYQNNGFGNSGNGYKSRQGGNNAAGGGNHRNQGGPGRISSSGSNKGGPGQYNRNKSSSQH